jgi:predicted transcriptional regulator
MDINSILAKTKKKADKTIITRLPPSIATDDRPYDYSSVTFNPHKQEINRKQTVNKLVTNCIQSEDKLDTNRKQTVNKPATNCKQTVNKPDGGNEETVNNIVNKLVTNRKQTVNKLVTESFTFYELTGLQKSITNLIYREIKKCRKQVTPPLTLEYIGTIVMAGENTVKTTIQRLVKKGMVIRMSSKNGRGGWSKYSLEETLFLDILQHENEQMFLMSNEETVNKPVTNRKQTVNKLVTEPITNSPSSSSYILKTTTTTDPESKKNFSEDGEELTQEDDEVKVSSLQHIGLSKAHIEQLKNSGLKNEIIQQSIDAFAFDLEHNGVKEKIKTQPLNYFMGILRGGIPYAFPANYQDQKAVAMKAYLDGVRRVKEERQKLEEEIFEFEFTEWNIRLTEDEVANIIPEKRYREYPTRDSFLKDHFKQKVWCLPKF